MVVNCQSPFSLLQAGICAFGHIHFPIAGIVSSLAASVKPVDGNRSPKIKRAEATSVSFRP
jgi:hypothetical protein